MPHLTFWNRYWRVAGDEFSIPAFCSILARTFWTLLITIVFFITINSLTACSVGWIFIVYLTISIAVFVASIACDTALLLISLKGSITETEQRSSLGFYLNIKIFLGALQIMCALFGLISLTAQSKVPCNSEFEQSGLTRAFITIVVVSQLIDVFSIICCCYLFSANKIDEEDRHQEPQDESWVLNTWENRCRKFTRSIQICSCNIFGGSNITEGFDEVAKVLTDFFHHDGFLDVVPSDVVAGIVLVRIEQRTVRRMVSVSYPDNPGNVDQSNGKQCSSFEVASTESPTFGGSASSMGFRDVDVAEKGGNVQITASLARSDVSGMDSSFRMGPNSNEVDPPLDLETLELISRMSVYALAIYTHLIVIYMRPCTGLCRVCCGAGAASCERRVGASCCCCLPNVGEGRDQTRSRGRGTVVEGDNFCGFNHTGLSIVTENLTNTELVYVSFKNDIVHKVYAVFLDHDKEQVVIAIRGTLSLEDCITDVICDPVPLDAVGEQFGFDGKGRFAHGGMLKAALGIRAELEANDTLGRIFNGYDSNLKTPLRERSNCTHYRLVLTGHSLGAGSAVLLALILRKSYPNLHCYAFGTPGSVVDHRSAIEFSSFVTTIVLGNDLVCRLSFRSLCRLRNDVLDAISRARVNKMMIMQAIFKEFDAQDLMYPPGQEPDTPFKRSIAEFKDLMRTRLVEQQINLCLPGKIIHLAKAKKGTKTCFGSTSYEIRSARCDDFEEILMSTTMGSDHLPDVYFYEIRKLLNERLRHMTV